MLLHRLSRQSLQYSTRHRLAYSFTSPRYSFSSQANEPPVAPALNITLYQYATCPFCNRVKSYLDFMQLEYSVVEVNPMSKKELKPLQQKQVPVVVANDEVVTDSGNIIQYIHDKLDPRTVSQLVSSEFMSEKSLKWSKWSGERLAVVLYPNITRTFMDSWAAFSYVSNVKDWTMMERITNRTLGPVAMYLVRNKIKQKHGIVDEQAEMLALLSEWTDALSTSSTDEIAFLEGSDVCQADLMVYGVLRGLKGLPTFDFIMSENGKLKKWYCAVDEVVSHGL